jgi:hypothetical protein
MWGQIFRNFKNAFTYLFIGLSHRLLMPIFGQIGHAGFKREARTWILVQILSKFDLWPLRVRSILGNFKNAVTGLFLGSSCLVVPIFVQIGLVGSEWQANMWFLLTPTSPSPYPSSLCDKAIHRASRWELKIWGFLWDRDSLADTFCEWLWLHFSNPYTFMHELLM